MNHGIPGKEYEVKRPDLKKVSQTGTRHDKAARATIINHWNHRIMVEPRVSSGGVKRSEKLW